MCLPEKVFCGIFAFDILYDAKKHKEEEENRMENIYGLTRKDLLEIVIDPSLPIQHKQSTLFHEIIHASLIHADFDEETEEKVAIAMESSLYFMLRDSRNKEVVKFLFDDFD